MLASLLILGRQPALGKAEAESLFGADAVTGTTQWSISLSLSASDIPFSRLGGSTRAGKILTYIDSTNWNDIERYIAAELPKHTCCLPEGKIRLGFSVYGIDVNVRRLNASGLTFKKAVKNDGRSVRVVPNKALELNTAQVLHNQLTGPTGIELLIIRDGNRTLLAQTTAVQDIDAYAARDQARPARDARVGMLPPKLAQIITNLAVSDANPKYGQLVLDPFCGTGVVLQEASLMGFDVRGSDLEPRMIDYSERNMRWLVSNEWSGITVSNPNNLMCGLDVGDATSFQWTPMPNFIACETYLGQPFGTEPSPDKLKQVMQDVDTIHRKFLQNIARQTDTGFRMCIAVPAWFTKNGVKHLKTLDSLEELGYNHISFVHADTRDLIYHRENQVVGRELVILTRK